MGLESLFLEGHYDKPQQSAIAITNELKTKTLIFFSVKATTSHPSKNWSQIFSIFAVAVDGGTNKEIPNSRFEMEAALNPETLRAIDMQKRIIDGQDKPGSVQWPEGEPTIDELLGLSDYDIDSEIERPDDTSVRMQFKGYIDQFRDPVLVAYNATAAMRHLNTEQPSKITSQVFDALQFFRFYFMPALQALMVGSKDPEASNLEKEAANMAKRMYDDFENVNINLDSMGRAVEIKDKKWHKGNPVRDEVFALARITIKVLEFMRRVQLDFDSQTGRSSMKKDQYHELVHKASRYYR